AAHLGLQGVRVHLRSDPRWAGPTDNDVALPRIYLRLCDVPPGRRRCGGPGVRRGNDRDRDILRPLVASGGGRIMKTSPRERLARNLGAIVLLVAYGIPSMWLVATSLKSDSA